jgi:hypothetical protein
MTVKEKRQKRIVRYYHGFYREQGSSNKGKMIERK